MNPLSKDGQAKTLSCAVVHDDQDRQPGRYRLSRRFPLSLFGTECLSGLAPGKIGFAPGSHLRPTSVALSSPTGFLGCMLSALLPLL
jgi:hypothetical protein